MSKAKLGRPKSEKVMVDQDKLSARLERVGMLRIELAEELDVNIRTMGVWNMYGWPVEPVNHFKRLCVVLKCRRKSIENDD